ncbi:hypothetical protein EUX98_g6903 [Antrodiella citrinella]|uniref:Uncharacterized protein n=1 Tax=Antrodiella citrinella TaxID=2447956 RepID=A0A4S4MN52_9APHY|nr:hypothetical protein EUX98_g6903 [Antrodiella citrinella]
MPSPRAPSLHAPSPPMSQSGHDQNLIVPGSSGSSSGHSSSLSTVNEGSEHHGRPRSSSRVADAPTTAASPTAAVGANQYIDEELLRGISLGFNPPVIRANLAPLQGPIPNVIALPYGRCPPFHLKAPSWRDLIKLMARLSGTRLEPTIEAMALVKTEMRLRVVVNFVKVHQNTSDWHIVLYMTIDQPVPADHPQKYKYKNGDPNLLPFSYSMSATPAYLREGADAPISKWYSIPSTAGLPYPKLPITFPDLATYLLDALEDSRRVLHDGSGGLRRLAKLVETCYPTDRGEERPGRERDRFGADMETQMFGSVKAYRRQIVISTGRSDWPHSVSDVPDSLAAYVNPLLRTASKPSGTSDTNGAAKYIPGIHDPMSSSSVTILNGSHRSVCEEPGQETVLVFPDFKVVTGVEHSAKSAQELWNMAVDPAVPRRGNVVEGSNLKSWVLPYSVVIMICSHKRRDNRCGISAPKLEHALTLELEREGWEVHTQVEEPCALGAALEDFKGTDEEKDAEVQRILHDLDPRTAETKRALIVKNSHFGGHKFAGNVVIYTPQGVGVWYGRVTPHVTEAVVRETIIKGKVLPPLLRGGVSLSQPGHESLHEAW